MLDGKETFMYINTGQFPDRFPLKFNFVSMPNMT